jgi:hypothetical protein
MTGRRRIRSTFRSTFLRPHHRPVRATALAAGALVTCTALTVGCGVVPGTTAGSGDGPIKVMTWAPSDTEATNKPGMPAFARAYARWINSKGGINGRRLTVLTCNEHNDAVSAATCARRAVKENVVAVVGSYSQYGDSFFPPLEGAGIPYIGGYGVTNDEFTSPLSYPVNGGQPTLLAGLGKELAAACGNVSLVRPDTIAGDELPILLDSGLTTGGHRRTPPSTRRSRRRRSTARPSMIRPVVRSRGAWCPRSATAPAPSWTPSGAPARTTRPCAPPWRWAASTRR